MLDQKEWEPASLNKNPSGVVPPMGLLQLDLLDSIEIANDVVPLRPHAGGGEVLVQLLAQQHRQK
ncbi:MAG: hypothetical protein JO110_30215 [Acetobacteraceae bacterium]|nr:hypothetical protein [Acetobacteraceae bacterium]